MGARRFDPVSSHETVNNITADTKLFDLICSAFNARQYPLTDTDLVEIIRERAGTTYQRNVVARSRSHVEKQGLIRSLGVMYSEKYRRKLLHFEKTTNMPNIMFRAAPSVGFPMNVRVDHLVIRSSPDGVAVLNGRTGQQYASRNGWNAVDLVQYIHALTRR